MKKIGFHLLLILIVLSAVIPSAVACTTCDPGPLITIFAGEAKMPNPNDPSYNLGPRIGTVQSGNWSTPSTWIGGVIPGPNDRVLIYHDVVFDMPSAQVKTVTISQDASLTFRTDMNTKLSVVHMLVFSGGELIVGTEASPIQSSKKAEIVIRNVSIDTTFDPFQYLNGLIAVGGKIQMHGRPMDATFMRVGVEPLRGQNQFTLSSPVTGWLPGDRILIPRSRQLRIDEDVSAGAEWEELTLGSISGNSVSFNPSLRFDHKGVRDSKNVLRYLPHVGNLTRNVIIRSENPAGTRGHTLFTGRSDIDIRYVGFQDLGRTKSDPVDNTSPDGSHIGTNQMGRYTCHFHRLYGPVATPANGYQYTLKGNSIENTTDVTTKWGITIHDSHYGLIEDNVVYNSDGWAIGTEDGSESFNRIKRNFVVRTRGKGGREDSRIGEVGYNGFGFWFSGPNNYVEQNVVANSGPYYAYDFFFTFFGNVKAPAFPGADPTQPGQSISFFIQTAPILLFDNNETYAGSNAFTIWDHFPTQRSVLSNFVAWHYTSGNLIYPHANTDFKNFTMLGDFDLLRRGGGAYNGLEFGDYTNRNSRVIGADIQGFAQGINLSNAGNNQLQEVKDSFLCNANNIVPAYGDISSLFPALSIQSISIDNVRFEFPPFPSPFPQPYSNIYSACGGWFPSSTMDVIHGGRVIDVTRFNGSPLVKDSFRIGMFCQQADAIAPYSTAARRAIPERGLTNQEAFTKYGLATAGRIMPTDTTRLSDGIHGPIEPLPGDPPLGLPAEKPVISLDPVSFIVQPDRKVSAKIKWVTNRPASSAVRDTGNSAFTRFSDVSNSTPKTSHTLWLRDLSPNKPYEFRVESQNAEGLSSFTWTLQSGETDPLKDTAPPQFEWAPRTVDLSATKASLSWTFAGVYPEYPTYTTTVEYGLTTSYGTTVKDLDPDTNDIIFDRGSIVRLTGLTPNTLYHFRVRLKDMAGNETVSSDTTFTTLSMDGTPFTISNINVINLTSRSAGIQFKPSRPQTSAWLEYGPSTSYGFSTPSDRVLPSGEHVNVLMSLNPDTLYHYRIHVRDVEGNEFISADQQFRTLTGAGTPPTITSAAQANPAAVSGKTTNVSVRATDDGGEPNLNYIWRAINNPPAAVQFVPNGTNAAKDAVATFAKAGRYQLEVLVRDGDFLTTTSVVVVEVTQTFIGIAVMPKNISIGISQTQQFTVTGQDQFSQPMPLGLPTTWTVTGGGTIDTNGLFRAGSALGGPFTVKVTAGSFSDTAQVTISNNNPPTVDAGIDLRVTLPSPANLVGFATDDGLPSPPGKLTITWSKLSGPGTVSFLPPDQLMTVAYFSIPGKYRLNLSVTDGQLSAADQLTVDVAGSGQGIPLGGSQQALNVVIPSQNKSVHIECNGSGRIWNQKGTTILETNGSFDWDGKGQNGKIVAGIYQFSCDDEESDEDEIFRIAVLN